MTQPDTLVFFRLLAGFAGAKLVPQSVNSLQDTKKRHKQKSLLSIKKQAFHVP
jgi:hypothetical protein